MAKHHFIVYSAVDGHLDCLQALAMTNYSELSQTSLCGHNTLIHDK